jgi:hypothetical protein
MSRYSVALNKPSSKRRKIKKIVKKAINKPDPYRELRKDIEWIIEDHSGGMKLTELIPELLSREKKHIGISTERIMNTILSSKKLSVLEYTWRPNHSSKYFIYTP